MKFNVNLKQFQEVIKKAEKCMTKKSVLQVLETLKVTATENNVTITATDLDHTFIFNLPETTITEPGITLLDKNTIKLIKKIKANIDITVTENSITAGKRNIEYFPIDVTSYPENPEVQNEKIFNLTDAKQYLNMLYASSTDETKRTFNTVVINRDDLVTTDTHRLALRKLDVDTGLENVLIDSHMLTTLNKIIGKKDNDTFDIYLDNNRNIITLENEDMTIISRLIDDSYPNYKQIIPSDNKYNIKINRQELLNELEFMKDIAKNTSEYNPFVMDINNNSLTVIANDGHNKINAEVDIITDSNFNLQIGFNVLYWIDMLKNFESDYITIGISSNLHPAVITESNKTDLILPVRIKDYNRYAA